MEVKLEYSAGSEESCAKIISNKIGVVTAAAGLLLAGQECDVWPGGEAKIVTETIKYFGRSCRDKQWDY